jgi:hypothetical protein
MAAVIRLRRKTVKDPVNLKQYAARIAATENKYVGGKV